MGADLDDVAVLGLTGKLLNCDRLTGHYPRHQGAVRVLELGLEDGQTLALGLVRGVAEEVFGRAAPEEDPALAVDDDNRQRRRVEDRPQRLGCLPERGLQGEALLHRRRLLADEIRHRGDDERHDGDAAEADCGEVDVAADTLEQQHRGSDQRRHHERSEPARRDAVILGLARACRDRHRRMQGRRGPQGVLAEVGQVAQRNLEPARSRHREPIGDEQRHDAAGEQPGRGRTGVRVEDEASHDAYQRDVCDQISDLDRPAQRADTCQRE